MSDPIVTPDDIGTYLGIDVTQPGVEQRLIQILGYAQSQCESIVTPLIPADAAVIVDVTVRAFSNPTNADASAVIGGSVNWGLVSGGLWLTKQNRATLRRNHGLGGAFTFDPTPVDAGTGLQPWDQNVTWLEGVPLAEDFTS